MGQRVLTQLVDDLDNTEGDDVGTVLFGLDGATYAIDLNQANAARLRNNLAEFVASARRTGGRKQRTHPVSQPEAAQKIRDREENQQIRDWAKENGWAISERGRIPANVLTAYRGRKTASSQRKKSRTSRPTVKS